mmetsp:Transcript_19602/g.36589  ORF Transcript_19602/g.36589 Transcript_19602/m.36589 type:complete len:405 (+) Transcript_19602:61-1275(+)
MGRSKQHVPKRRRIEEETAEQDAIALLRQVPQDQVEVAAAEATRLDLVHWPHLVLNTQPDGDSHDYSTSIGAATPATFLSSIPSWARGLGSVRRLDERHFMALKTLHETIKGKAKQWTSWSGTIDDPRKRAFGFLPGTLGYQPSTRQQLDISMPWTGPDATNDVHNEVAPKESSGNPQPSQEPERVNVTTSSEMVSETQTDAAAEERSRNQKAVVLLPEIPEGAEDAIEHVCELFRGVLMSTKETAKTSSKDDQLHQLADFLHFRNLIAAQPNLHSGRALLPIHLDHPRKDGFGVVIVTIAMEGGATILLQDAEGVQRIAMPVQSGEAYMLADRARDACAHGVLADVGGEHRESLNLRFGLHDFVCENGSQIEGEPSLPTIKSDKLPVIPARQVLQYWETSINE